MSRSSIFIVFFIAILLSSGIQVSPYSAKKGEIIVRMVEMSFVPKNITIEKGQTLTFINESRYLHNVVFPLLQKRSKFIRRGKKVSFTFQNLGEFNYYRGPHKSMGMVGTLKVTDGRNKLRDSSTN